MNLNIFRVYKERESEKMASDKNETKLNLEKRAAGEKRSQLNNSKQKNNSER